MAQIAELKEEASRLLAVGISDAKQAITETRQSEDLTGAIWWHWGSGPNADFAVGRMFDRTAQTYAAEIGAHARPEGPSQSEQRGTAMADFRAANCYFVGR